MWLCWLFYFQLKKLTDKSQSAFFPRVKNFHSRKTSKGSNFGWLIRQMSINQKSGWQTFRRRFVSGSLFVSSCPPDCNFQSETKVEPDLMLNPILWIRQLVSLILIRWIVIYLVDNAIYMTGSRESIRHVMPLDDPSVILSFSKEKAHSITGWHIQSYTFWNVAITAQQLLPSAHPCHGARSGRAGGGKLRPGYQT